MDFLRSSRASGIKSRPPRVPLARSSREKTSYLATCEQIPFLNDRIESKREKKKERERDPEEPVERRQSKEEEKGSATRRKVNLRNQIKVVFLPGSRRLLELGRKRRERGVD